jgi:hypothetical protein
MVEVEGERATGGCLRGSIRYEADLDTGSAYYCHCPTCQKLSGTPAETSVPVKPGSLHFTKGMPSYFQSSPFAERGFCPDCGSRLTYRMLSGDWTTVAIGCLDHPDTIKPTKHYCIESQLSWYRTDDQLPRLRTEEIPELVELWAAAEKHD